MAIDTADASGREETDDRQVMPGERRHKHEGVVDEVVILAGGGRRIAALLSRQKEGETLADGADSADGAQC